MTIWAVLPAAGVGRRVGSSTPKQYLDVGATPLILHSLRRLSAVSAIEKIIVVVHPDDCYWSQLYSSIEAEFEDRIESVIGGDERYQSVLNGLLSLATKAKSDDWVLVHDAVRPCVRTSDIEHLIATLQHHPVGGLLGYPMDNTLKHVEQNNEVIETVDREAYWNALTPQMFRYAMLREAIETVVASGATVTDEAAALEAAGHRPAMVAGNKDNIKVTHAADLQLVAQILETQVREHESE
jgi:2-C-methyl-D-erythritol 4-phosphate cytidylyltransferase